MYVVLVIVGRKSRPFSLLIGRTFRGFQIIYGKRQSVSPADSKENCTFVGRIPIMGYGK